MEGMNRYRLARELTTFISRLSKKYRIINNDGGINVSVKFEKHLADRCIDRKVPKPMIEKLLTRLIRNKICELVYFCELRGGSSRRVNIKDKDSGYLFGCNVRRTRDNNYYVNIRTVYKERDKTHKEIEAIDIFI